MSWPNLITNETPTTAQGDANHQNIGGEEINNTHVHSDAWDALSPSNARLSAGIALTKARLQKDDCKRNSHVCDALLPLESRQQPGAQGSREASTHEQTSRHVSQPNNA